MTETSAPAKAPMTVGELIDKLAQYDLTLPVFFECEDDYYSGSVQQEAFEEGEAFLLKEHDGKASNGYGREWIRHYPEVWSTQDWWHGDELVAKTVKCLKLLVNG